MKKLNAFLLAAALTAALAGCAKSPVSGAAASSEAASTEAVSSEAASTEAVSAAEAEVTVMTHAAYEAAALDSQVCVETYVQAKQSWWEDKATLYTQAEDGAYFIYDMPISQEEYDKLVPGTKIRVTGYKSEWSGEVEITDAAYEILEGSFVAEPTDVTDLLGTDDLAAHQNELVSFKGMTVELSKDANGKEAPFLYSWDGSGEEGSDLYFNVSKDGQTYTFTVESYLCDKDSEVYQAVKNLQAGDVIDMEGFLYWYNGANPHITAVTAAAE